MLFDDYMLFLVGAVVAGLCLALAAGVASQLEDN